MDRGGFGDQLGGVGAGVVHRDDRHAEAMPVGEKIAEQNLRGRVVVERELRLGLHLERQRDLADEADDQRRFLLARHLQRRIGQLIGAGR